MNEDEIKDIFEININGVAMGTIIVFNNMLSQGYGKIFNMEGFGSDGRINKKICIYGISKRAVNYLTKAFAKEACGINIQIGVLNPGVVITDSLKNPINITKDEAKEEKNI